MTVSFMAECWTGQLPLVKITEWNKVYNVIYLSLYYEKRTIKLNGMDYYYFYRIRNGYIAGGWTDPWKCKNYIGREYVFSNKSLIFSKNLKKPPQVESKEGFLLPDSIAKELDLI